MATSIGGRGKTGTQGTQGTPPWLATASSTYSYFVVSLLHSKATRPGPLEIFHACDSPFGPLDPLWAPLGTGLGFFFSRLAHSENRGVGQRRHLVRQVRMARRAPTLSFARALCLMSCVHTRKRSWRSPIGHLFAYLALFT